MRKLSVSTLVTLDGVIQDPGGFGEIEQGGWGNPYFTEDAQQDAYEHLMVATICSAGGSPTSCFPRLGPKSRVGHTSTG